MNDVPWREEIDRDSILAGYFFYGEETFLADQFLDELKNVLFPDDEEERIIERFSLESHPWRDIIDSARTVPLLFSPSRLIYVEGPRRKKENIPSPKEQLNSEEKQLLEGYFSSPIPNTVMVVIFPGRIRKTSALIKFLSSLPPSAVSVKEVKPLKNRALKSWTRHRFFSFEKKADSDAIQRLLELTGNDLRRIHNEIEKVVTYVNDRKQVNLDDINHVAGWVRSIIEWEVAESLEKADYRNCLVVVNRLLDKEGVTPVNVMGLVAGFFRDLLLTKLRLKEGERDRKAIFKEINPQILEKYGRLYHDKFKQLFSTADSISMQDLEYILNQLREVDLKLKTTPLSFQALIEGFLFEYCWMRRYGRISGSYKNSILRGLY